MLTFRLGFMKRAPTSSFSRFEQNSPFFWKWKLKRDLSGLQRHWRLAAPNELWRAGCWCPLNNLLILEDGRSGQVRGAQSTSVCQTRWLWSSCVMKLGNLTGLFQPKWFYDSVLSSLKCAIFFPTEKAGPGPMREARVSGDDQANSSPVVPVEMDYILLMRLNESKRISNVAKATNPL